MMQLPFNVLAQKDMRPAAWAGSFYDSDPVLLKKNVIRYLSDGKPLSEPVRLLICPHAGFIFSGPVAGKGYATLDKRTKRVLLLGPSHHQAFSGIAVSSFSSYETPLGNVPVDREVVDKLKREQGVIEAKGFDGQEHSLEVQLPFLQVLLKEFTVVPIITGKADPARVADLLLPLIDEKTAVIASSDLSHYEKQGSAEAIDAATVSTILSGNMTGPVEACGATAIRIVMQIAARLKYTPVKIDVRTSFDTAPEHCPKDRVVGYAAIGYISTSATERDRTSGGSVGREPEQALSDAVRHLLLRLARQSLEAAVRKQPFTMPKELPADVRENSGCFVTLTVHDNLRGCIGYIEPIKPLYQAVIDNAESAALSDPRFSPVRPDELSQIKVEVSVLTKPEPLSYRDPDDLLSKLVPGRDGVILSDGRHQSTYLPQVWEQLPDKIEFLQQLSMKGGMPSNGWKTADVKTYRAIHFSE